MKKLTIFSAVLVVGAAGAASAGAGVPDGAPGAPAHNREDPVLVYDPAFFSNFNPQTALDMVRRVPGFTINGGGGGRGLAGNLGNVLIDGRRPGSKSGVSRLLQRMPAASILRIELVRAPVPGVDMAGQDEVVNIITDPDGGWSGAWRARTALYEGGRAVPSGEASLTRTSPSSTLTLNASLSANANGHDSVRQFFTPEGARIGALEERIQDSFYDFTPSLAYQRVFEAGHTFRLDARVWAFRFDSNRFGFQTGGTGALTGAETGVTLLEGTGGEVSVDYDHVFSPVWSLKATGLQRLDFRERDGAFDTLGPSGAFRSRVLTEQAEDSGETVLRLEARRTASPARSTTLALEGAFNFLDGAFDVFTDNGSGPVQVFLPVSDTRVEEHRLDASASHVWRPTSGLTLEGAFGAEFSRIAQTGDAEQERTLAFFKPEVTASWSPTSDDQVRLSVRRLVGQLSFGNFISSVNVSDDTSQRGNPDLEPERLWRIQADWERKFSRDGSVSLLVFHEWVDAVPDLIPVAGVTDAPGNLGDGTRWRLQAAATTPLDMLGIPGALLTASARVQESRVEDPVTGAIRRFRGQDDWRASIDFRQDLPELGFAWGFDYSVRGPEDFYRLAQFERQTRARGDLDVFAEVRAPAGLTARIGADLNLGSERRERVNFPGPRNETDPSQIEQRLRDFDGVAYFQLSGVF